MTNNEKPVTDAELKKIEQQKSKTVRAVQWAINKLNAGLRKIGASEIPLDETIAANWPLCWFFCSFGGLPRN